MPYRGGIPIFDIRAPALLSGCFLTIDPDNPPAASGGGRRARGVGYHHLDGGGSGIGQPQRIGDDIGDGPRILRCGHENAEASAKGPPMGEWQIRFRIRAHLRRWNTPVLGLDDDGIHAEAPTADIATEGNGPAGEGPNIQVEGCIRRHKIRVGIGKGGQPGGFRGDTNVTWATCTVTG